MTTQAELDEWKVFVVEYFNGWSRTPYKHEISKAAKEFRKQQKQTNMKIEGNIKLIGETVKFESGFTKRQLVVTTNETYPQEVPIDFVKDNVTKLDSLSVGMNVSVDINIRGNEHNGKYYVSLNGWKVQTIESERQSSDDLPV